MTAHRYDTREVDSSWRHRDCGGGVCRVRVCRVRVYRIRVRRRLLGCSDNTSQLSFLSSRGPRERTDRIQGRLQPVLGAKLRVNSTDIVTNCLWAEV